MTKLGGSEELDPSPSRSTAIVGDLPSASEGDRYRLRTLVSVFLTESLVLALAQWPLNLDFTSFMFMDQGVNLTVQELLDRGLVPTVDFGYQYGLVPLLLGRSWFAALGRTPEAYAAAMLVIDLLIAWGLARCAHALSAGPVGIALIMVTMLATTLGTYINLAHACEAALICHALADHASGRRPRALALLTACLFVKPVMAYVYGFLVLILILRSGGLRRLVPSVGPAAVTGVLFLIGLTAWFGTEPVIQSLLPVRGAESYKMLNYGFFTGIGRRFWLPEVTTPRHYIFTAAGHYLFGSVVLGVAAAASLWRLARGYESRNDMSAEVIVCCGIMHFSFLTLFYGDTWSWTYYYYILIVGLVAVAARGRRSTLVVALVALLALAGFKDWGGNIKHQWRDKTRGADTFGLWADSDSRDEWRQIREMIGDKSASFLGNNGGCLEMYMPQFADSEDTFLIPGYPTEVELARKLKQIASVDVVLIRTMAAVRPFLDLWPEFREALTGFEPAGSTAQFLVYRRLRPATSTPADTRAESATAERR